MTDDEEPTVQQFCNVIARTGAEAIAKTFAKMGISQDDIPSFAVVAFQRDEDGVRRCAVACSGEMVEMMASLKELEDREVPVHRETYYKTYRKAAGKDPKAS